MQTNQVGIIIKWTFLFAVQNMIQGMASSKFCFMLHLLQKQWIHTNKLLHYHLKTKH